MTTQHRWRGESGAPYTYVIHEWPAPLSPVPGNYMIARHYPKIGWLPFLIDETPDLSTLTDDPRIRLIARDPSVHIHIRPNLDAQFQRQREVHDLVRRWKPPGNEPSLVGVVAHRRPECHVG